LLVRKKSDDNLKKIRNNDLNKLLIQYNTIIFSSRLKLFDRSGIGLVLFLIFIISDCGA